MVQAGESRLGVDDRHSHPALSLGQAPGSGDIPSTGSMGTRDRYLTLGVRRAELGGIFRCRAMLHIVLRIPHYRGKAQPATV